MKDLETIASISFGALSQNTLIINTPVDIRMNNAAAEYAMIVPITKAMNVDQVIITVPTQALNPVYEISLQGVDSNGDPDNTILGGASPASTEYTPIAGGTYEVVTLDNAFNFTASDVTSNRLACIRIRDNQSAAQSPDATNYIDIRAWNNQYYWGPPYASISTDTGSTWTKQATYMPYWGLRNSGAAADVMGFPVATITSSGSQVLTVGHIAAAKFVLPASLGRRVKIRGCFVFLYAFGTFTVGVYDSAGAALVESATLNDLQTGSALSQCKRVAFPDTWLPTGVELYLGATLKEATFSLAYYGISSTENLRSAFAGYPDNGLYKWTGAAWVQATTEVAMVAELLVSEWDAHGIEMQHLNSGMVR